MGIKALRRRLEHVVDSVDGIMGVAIHDSTTAEEIGVRADERFPMASVCKTPILIETFRRVDSGDLSLDTLVEITPETRTSGSGLLNYFDVGLKPTLRDLLLLMIVVSDNAATDLVLSHIGGPTAVTACMTNIKLPSIRLDRTIRQLLADISEAVEPTTRGMDYHEVTTFLEANPEISARFQDAAVVRTAIVQATAGRDEASPRDIARLYARLVRQECLTPESTQAALKILERQQLRNRLPRELPPNTRTCNKTGTLGPGTVTNDSGLIYIGDHPIAIAVLSRNVVQPPADTNSAVARIGRIVYDYYAAASIA